MENTGSASPYDPERNPTYKIDHTVEYSGKVVASTKRRVKFAFGFANAEALESGAVGIDCRGSEHTVELVWSITSGKRRLLMDNRELHFSIAHSTESKFLHSWTIAGNGVTVTLIAHAASMSSKTDASEEWKRYDLLVNDSSFFEMPKVFQLGIKPRKQPASSSSGAPAFATAAPQPPAPQPVAKVETMDLLGFYDMTPPAPSAPAQAPPAYHAPPPPVYASVAPAAAPQAQDNAFAFASAPVPPAPAAAPASPTQPTVQYTKTFGQNAFAVPPPAVHAVSPTTPMQEDEEPPVREPILGVESAMKNNLVNFNLGFPSAAGHEQASPSLAKEAIRAVSPPPTAMAPQQPVAGYGYQQQQRQQPQTQQQQQYGYPQQAGAPQLPPHRSTGFGATQQGGYSGAGYQQTY